MTQLSPLAIEMLNRLAESLLSAPANPTDLGLVPKPSPTMRRISITDNDTGWEESYYVEELEKWKQRPFGQVGQCLKGRLIDIATLYRKYKDSKYGDGAHKLLITVQGDVLYQIDCGLYSTYAMTLCDRLSLITDFKQPIYIGAKPSDEKAVFAEVWDSQGNPVRTTNPLKGEVWRESGVCLTYINKIRAVLGLSPISLQVGDSWDDNVAF